MNKKIRTEAVDFLFDAILSLQNKEECYTFFEDVCTINELLSLSQRFEVAKMLREQKELKSKTIRLVSNQDNNVADAPLQSIHNDRVPVCPQANARRSGRKGGIVLFCVCLSQRSAAFDLAKRSFTMASISLFVST